MRVPRARSLTYLIIAGLIGSVSWAIGVGSVFGQRAEAFVLEAAELNYSPPAPLGLLNTPVAIMALVILSILAFAVHGMRRAATVFAAVAVAVVSSQLLKQDVLVRPELFEFNAANTFPSGHMTVFAALSGAIIWAVPKKAQGATVWFTAALCATVSWQLLEHSWHRPSDVIGAFALSLMVFALCALLAPLASKRSAASTEFRGGVSRRGVFSRGANLALMAISVLLFLGGAILSLIAVWTGSAQLMLNGAQLVVMSLSVFTVRAFQALTP